MLLAAQVVLGIYAVLLAVGGIIGFMKAGSRPSLIAGLVSAAIAAVCLALSARGNLGFPLAAVLALIMSLVFGMRLAKTRKLMPSGMLLGISIVVLIMMGVAMASGS
jgi:uncharacterized membrane protein (UPF0136 family)